MHWQNNAILADIETALADFQSAHPDLHGWQLEAKQTHGRQTLMLGNNEQNTLHSYQDRNVSDASFQLSLFVPSEDGDKMGTAKGTVDPAGSLLTQFETLLGNARQAMNPFFTLPEPDIDYPDASGADPDILGDLHGAHLGLEQQLCRQTETLQGVQVNSAELYTNKHEHLILSSTGIRASRQSTDIYFEVAMEKRPLPNNQEVLKYWHFVSLDDIDITRLLAGVAEEAKLTDQANLPPAREDATILVDAYAISKFIAALASRLDAGAEFSQAPHFVADDKVFTGDKDPQSDCLTLTVDPTLEQMAKTSPYTNEGLPAQKAIIIQDDTVLTQTINSRMAQYLDKPANHIFGNYQVSPGQASREQLLDQEEVFEILDFSSLLVNPTSLTWSSEIKLGRWHRRGQPTVMVKGGIVSGSLKSSLSGFRFSKDTVRRNTTGGYFEATNGYTGPAYMLTWRGITLAGQEDNNE